MMYLKSTVLISGAGLFAMWITSMNPMVDRSTTMEEDSVESFKTNDFSTQTLFLNELLGAQFQVATNYEPPIRNPFQFALTDEALASRSYGEVGFSVDQAAGTAGESARVKLIGIAGESTSEKTIYTAIITMSDQLFLVKKGDFLDENYSVFLVNATGVELHHVDDGKPLRLDIKP
jgi:hypothetical protein